MPLGGGEVARGVLGEIALEGLMPALGLALDLGVVGATVPLGHAEVGQQALESGAAAPADGVVDGDVVGELPRRGALALDGRE